MQSFKSSQCCHAHPHLRLMLHAAAEFLTRTGVHWWLGHDETTGSMFNDGKLLPWQTSATIYFAVFGPSVPDGFILNESPALKSTKNEFVSKLVKFNAEQKYLPYTMRVCANKYSLPAVLPGGKTLAGKPPTYAREWVYANKTSSATCYLVSRASSIPFSKTPIYLTLAHSDMDPSPTLRLVPKMVRGACIEPWRSGSKLKGDADFLPLSWVLPAKPCANGLYGRPMQCVRNLKAMDYSAAAVTAPGVSAWRRKFALESKQQVGNFTQWLVDEYCPTNVVVM
jgi:hypothetical protein